MNPQMPGLLTEKQKEIERERRKKQSETKTGMKYKQNLLGNKFPNKNYDDNKATQKIADIFNTNRSSAEGITGRRKTAKRNKEAIDLLKK